MAKRFSSWRWVGKQYLRTLPTDFANVVRFGLGAPRVFEQVWIDPNQCQRFIPIKSLRNVGLIDSVKVVETSGRVSECSWPVEDAVSVRSALLSDFRNFPQSEDQLGVFTSLFKFRVCHDHWVKGVPWSNTGIFDFLLFLVERTGSAVDGGCRTRNDLEKRYERLDTTFDEIQKSGKFKTQRELLASKTFRGRKSIYVHIGPEGEVFWGQSAQHRFAIAHILNLPFPAQLGVTHISGLARLQVLRAQSKLLSGEKPK